MMVLELARDIWPRAQFAKVEKCFLVTTHVQEAEMELILTSTRVAEKFRIIWAEAKGWKTEAHTSLFQATESAVQRALKRAHTRVYVASDCGRLGPGRLVSLTLFQVSHKPGRRPDPGDTHKTRGTHKRKESGSDADRRDEDEEWVLPGGGEFGSSEGDPEGA